MLENTSSAQGTDHGSANADKGDDGEEGLYSTFDLDDDMIDVVVRGDESDDSSEGCFDDPETEAEAKSSGPQ